MDEEKQLVLANDSDETEKLPGPSQRQGKLLQKPNTGVYYETPHLRMHPVGWHTRRHFKRKKLRRSMKQYAIIDRIGTQFIMLPLAIGTLVMIVVIASTLVSLTAVVESTQERYQPKVTTLEGI